MSVRRKCESFTTSTSESKLLVPLTTTITTESDDGSGSGHRCSSGLAGLPTVLYGHIQSYLYTDDISNIILVDKSINRMVINYIKSHPFDIECEFLEGTLAEGSSPLRRKSEIERDLLSIPSLSALTIIARHCHAATVRRLKLPWRVSRQYFAKRSLDHDDSSSGGIDEVAAAMTATPRIDPLIMTIIKQNHQSIMEVSRWGSHFDNDHLTLMSTCPRLIKWDSRSPNNNCHRMKDLQQLYQMCPMLSHLQLTGLEALDKDGNLEWMNGNTFYQSISTHTITITIVLIRPLIVFVIVNKGLTQLTNISIGGPEAFVHQVMSSLSVALINAPIKQFEIATLQTITMKRYVMPIFKSRTSLSLEELMIHHFDTSRNNEMTTLAKIDPGIHEVSSSSSSLTYITMPKLQTLNTPMGSSLEFPIISAPKLEILLTYSPSIILAQMLASNQSRLKQLNWSDSVHYGTTGTTIIVPSLLSSPSLPYVVSSLNDVPSLSCQCIEQLHVRRPYIDFISILTLCRSSTMLRDVEWTNPQIAPSPITNHPPPPVSTLNRHQLASLLASFVNLTKFRAVVVVPWSDDEKGDGHNGGYCLQRLTHLTLEGNWGIPFLSILRLPSVTSLSISDGFFNEASLRSLKSSSLEHIFSFLSSSSQLVELKLHSKEQAATPTHVNLSSSTSLSPSLPVCYSLKRLRRLVFDWKMDADIIIGLLHRLCGSEKDSSLSSSTTTSLPLSMSTKEVESKEKCQLTRFHYHPLQWPRVHRSHIAPSYKVNAWLKIIPVLPTTITLIGTLSSVEQVRSVLRQLPHLRTIQILKLTKSETIDIYKEVMTYCRDVLGCIVPSVFTDVSTPDNSLVDNIRTRIRLTRCIARLDGEGEEVITNSSSSSSSATSLPHSHPSVVVTPPPRASTALMISIHVVRHNGAGLLEGQLIGDPSTWPSSFYSQDFPPPTTRLRPVLHSVPAQPAHAPN
jgi:hypothetical protein